MKFLILIVVILINSCIVKPSVYNYKLRNKFELDCYDKNKACNLRTDCFYIYSDKVETDTRTSISYEFLKFYKNGRVYISETFYDSIPDKTLRTFNALEDVYIKTNKFDYNTGRKAFYIIDKNGFLKVEKYFNAGSGYGFLFGNINKESLNLFKLKMRNGGKTKININYFIKEYSNIQLEANW